MERKTKTIAQVVGENVRKFRGDSTLEDVAIQGKKLGSNWSSGSISAIERGNFKVTIENLLLLSLALGHLKGQGAVPLSELVSGENWLMVNDGFRIHRDDLLAYLSGAEIGDDSREESYIEAAFAAKIEAKKKELGEIVGPWDWGKEETLQRVASREALPSEVRIAKRLGIEPRELIVWSQHLWATSFEDQRDIRSGEGASAQKRGRVSRELMEEIRKAREEFYGDD